MADAAERKRAELLRKAGSLEAELAHWLKLSEPKGALEVHNSQIRRLSSQLSGYRARLDHHLGKLAPDLVLAQAAGLEGAILELHRIWDFFRTKLALRLNPWLRDLLAVADELAWSLYRLPCAAAVKAKTVAAEAVKEPPLVFLNGGASPVALPRGVAYGLDASPYLGLPLHHFAEVLKALPIPVIGIPWFQVSHLPDALLIGHEVGHHVQDDLGLGPQLDALLAGAQLPSAETATWLPWRDEMVADLFGTLTLGPAFAGALDDFLATDAGRIAAETPATSGSYPTVYLRLWLCFAALERLGFEAQAAGLRADWRQRHPTHQLGPLEQDVPAVVETLLLSPLAGLGESSLRDIKAEQRPLRFTAGHQARAEEVASDLLQPYPYKPGTKEVRTLPAGARLAFAQDPDAFGRESTQKVLHASLRDALTGGVRAGGTRARAGRDDQLRHRDEEAGAALFGRVQELLKALS